MKLKKLILVVIATMSVSAKAPAESKGGGGGDLCEAKIRTIQTNIRSWISLNGYFVIQMPADVTREAYAQKMNEQLSKAKVRCVSPGDAGYPVNVNGTAKECRFDRDQGISQITCEADKFERRSEFEQYQLVHHELAGLAGLENPSGDVSSYTLTNQLTSFITDDVVKRHSAAPSARLTSWDKLYSLFETAPKFTYPNQWLGYAVSGRCFEPENPDTPIAAVQLIIGEDSDPGPIGNPVRSYYGHPGILRHGVPADYYDQSGNVKPSGLLAAHWPLELIGEKSLFLALGQSGEEHSFLSFNQGYAVSKTRYMGTQRMVMCYFFKLSP